MPGVGRRSRRIVSPHPLRGFGGRDNRKSCSYKVSTVTPAGVDEVQTVTLTGTPGGGTWTFTFRGQTTTGIAYNATNATVEDAIELLSTVGAGNVRVTGSAGGPWTITFINDLGNQNVDAATVSGASLTGGTTPAAGIAQTTAGSDANAGRLFVRRGTIIMAYSGDASKVTAWDGASATTALGVLAEDYEWISADSPRNDADLSYWGGPGNDFLTKNLIGFAGHEANFRTWAGVHGCVLTEGTT